MNLVAKANQSSRARGAVGADPLVYRKFRELCHPGPHGHDWHPKVLDFGAGKDMVHTRKLQEEGYAICGYEFGDNVRSHHVRNALASQWNYVLASNVLNVQGSVDMLRRTMNEIVGAVLPGGTLVANYPKSPRYTDVDDYGIERRLKLRGMEIVSYKRGVFVAKKPFLA